MSITSPQPLPEGQDEPELSLEQARRVIWQTQPKKPMGKLLDAGIIDQSDLAWARLKAYRPEVRSAARVLLRALDTPPALPNDAAPPAHTVRPEPPRYGPRVVTASTYLEDRQETAFGRVMFGVGMGIVAMAFVTWFLIWAIFFEGSMLAVVTSLVSLTLCAGLLVSYLHSHLTAWRNARQGRQGEEQALDALRESLDHRWTVYRNLQLPDRTADLDLVLVGPGGVWCVQVKAYRAPLRYREGRWQTRRGKVWRPCDPAFDPEKAVTAQAVRLHNFLGREGVERFVERAIALAEGVPLSDVAGSPIPVWLPPTIRQQTAGLSTRYPLRDDERTTINAILSRRADAQRAVEQDRRRHRRA